MAEKITNELIYEFLKDIFRIQKNHSEEFWKINLQLESIDLHMATLNVTVSHQQQEAQATCP